MTDHGHAIDLWLGSKMNLSAATRQKYWEIAFELMRFCEGRGVEPYRLELNHCRGFLAGVQRRGVSASTQCLYVSAVRSYVKFLAGDGILEEDYSAKLERPRRPRPEDLDVVTTSGDDVERLIAACVVPSRREEWDELLCIGTLTYLGWRRNAAAQARREDVNLEEGLMRGREKGGKVIWKPIPNALLELYRAAAAAGVWLEPRDFLIPNRRPTRVQGQRSNKVVYAIVKRVAARARVSAHPHSLRAAFAVQFDEQHPDLQHTLQILMGHARPETTHIYLRRKNKARAMEDVRDLSFALRSRTAMPPTGFEPVLPPQQGKEPLRRKLDALDALEAGDTERARST